MSDFSHEYKSALEKTEISPDFKERTMKKMQDIRDKKTPRFSVTIGASAALAAAACAAIVIAAGKMGAFEDIPESIITEETAPVTAAEIMEDVTEAVSGTETDISHGEETQRQRDALPTAEETGTVTTVTEDTAIQTETAVSENNAVQAESETPIWENTSVQTEAVTVYDETAAFTAEENTKPADSAASEDKSAASAAEKAVSEEYIRGEAVYMPPVPGVNIPVPASGGADGAGDEIIEDSFVENILVGEGSANGDCAEETVTENDEVSDENEDSTDAENVWVGEGAETETFDEVIYSEYAKDTAKTDVTALTGNYTSLTVTDTTGGYDTQSGRIVINDPVTVTDSNVIGEIMSAVQKIVREGSPASVSGSQGRYIADLTDDSGGAVRVAVGQKQLVIRTGDGIYGYTADSDELSALAELLKEISENG